MIHTSSQFLLSKKTAFENHYARSSIFLALELLKLQDLLKLQLLSFFNESANTLNCQTNGVPNKQGGRKKLRNFNKRGVKINGGGRNVSNDFT